MFDLQKSNKHYQTVHEVSPILRASEGYKTIPHPKRIDELHL